MSVNNYSSAISAASARYGVPDRLLTAQLQQESGFNPYAVSSAGAEGIAQFMPATARSIGLVNPFDPTAAINAAAKYDAQNYRRFGNWRQALEAYNEGPTAVASGTVYPQAADYAQSILNKANIHTTPSGATYYRQPNGDLVVNFGGANAPSGSIHADGTGSSGDQSASGAGTCPINDTPILSIWGYAIITPCGLWDLAVGIVGLVLIIAGLHSDVGKTIMTYAKSVPLE